VTRVTMLLLTLGRTDPVFSIDAYAESVVGRFIAADAAGVSPAVRNNFAYPLPCVRVLVRDDQAQRGLTLRRAPLRECRERMPADDPVLKSW
jgi:hypothetical protein